MGEVIDSISQPHLRTEVVHMEPEEEKQETNGVLELLPLV